MGLYLRDKEISHVAIDGATLSRLVDVFTSQGVLAPEYEPNDAATDNLKIRLSFLIRFDERGYRVFDKEQLLHLFNEASVVERIIFELISDKAQQSNRIIGSYAELRLDSNETARCFLTVSSDDEAWMRGCFAAIEDILSRCNSRASLWIRHPAIELLLQLMGVFLGFVASLWGATKISPYLIIENAFLISFLLVLLVFSNLWIPIGQKIRQFFRSVFPKIRFDRPQKDKLAWLYRSVVAGLVLAVVLYVLGLLFSYAGKLLGGFIAMGG